MIIPFYEYNHNLPHASTMESLDFPPHLHNCSEMIRVRAGVLKVQIDTGNHTLHAGDLAVILPNTIHSFQTLTQPCGTLIDMITCSQDPQAGLPRQLTGRILAEPVRPVSSCHPDVDYAFSTLLSEVNEADSAPIVSAYFQILWHRLLPSLEVTDAVAPPVSNLAANLIAYVAGHFQSPLSLDSLSRELGVCRFHISRIFTQVLHMGFYEYVNALRINYAKNLLLGTEYKILEVAELSGFQSQQTFNRIFREFCGITPSIYRQRGLL